MDAKKISETLTLAAPVLIVCSCIRLITFYQRWNVPIFDYLSASELLMLFIQPVLVIVALAALYFASNVLLTAAALVIVKLKPVRKRLLDAPKADVPQESPPTKYPIWVWVIFLVGLATMAGTYFNAVWYEFEIFPTVLLHVVLLLVAVAAIRQALPPAEKESVIKPLVAATVVVLMSASFFYGRYQAHMVETRPTSFAITLKDSAVLRTDSDHIFLGKTSNYYFFHNTKDKETSIIPVGEVRATYIK